MILFTLLFLLPGVLVGLLLRLQRRRLPDSRQRVQSRVRETLEEMESQYQLRLLTNDLRRETQPPGYLSTHRPPDHHLSSSAAAGGETTD